MESNAQFTNDEFEVFLNIIEYAYSIYAPNESISRKVRRNWCVIIAPIFFEDYDPGSLQNAFFPSAKNSSKLPNISRSLFKMFEKHFELLIFNEKEHIKKDVQDFGSTFGNLDENRLLEIREGLVAEKEKEFYVFREVAYKRFGNVNLKKQNISSDEGKGDKVPRQDLLETFQNTNWHCYSRKEENHVARIAKQVFCFKEFYTAVQCHIVLTHYDERYGNWVGAAKFFPQDIIVIELNRDRPSNKEAIEPAHLFLKFKKSLKELTVMYGHITFRHLKSDNIITDTIVLSKITDQFSGINAGLFKSNDPQIHEDFSFNNALSVYFAKRELNRLSSPIRPEVYNLSTFSKWVKPNRPAQNVLYEPIVGTYDLLYKLYPSAKFFVRDELELHQLEDGRIRAKYSHKFDEHYNEVWFGEGSLNFETKALSIYLVGPQIQANDSISKDVYDDMPIFILIDLPSKTIPTIDTLTGIISGLRDTETGTVSRLFALLKRTQDKIYPNGYDDVQLQRFFKCYSNRSWVRPPSSTVISRFSDLKAARVKTARKLPEKERGNCEYSDEQDE